MYFFHTMLLFFALSSCRRCDGAGKLTCLKCKGYGYLKKGAEDTIKAFKASNMEDVSTIYLCPFCKGQASHSLRRPERPSVGSGGDCLGGEPGRCTQGTVNCFDCRGKAKLWPQRLNVDRLFKLRHVHDGAAERAQWQALTAEKSKEKELKRKVDSGLGGFKISGNANYLPYSDEELAQQQAEAAKKG